MLYIYIMIEKILIVDDDPLIIESIELLLNSEVTKIDKSESPKGVKELVSLNDYDLILLDMNFSPGINSGKEGLDLLKKIIKAKPDSVVVMMTAFADINLAVEAMKFGATDFIQKPLNAEKLLATIKSAYQLRLSKKKIKELEYRKKNLETDLERFQSPIIGNSEAMQRLHETIAKVAQTDTNVLITGENGTGKELVARQIHKLSLRSKNIFVSVDMASLSEGLFESELFGHVKGSFTDAISDRVGRFEMASGGSIFLDEIGNLSYSLQAKLLSVIQNRKISRIGSNREIDIDIRLISATNKDLFKAVENNIFREDLLYRINTVHIQIPPLRQRGKDIELLAEFFLKKYATKYEKYKIKMSNKAYDKLNRYKWPGNVRELQHVIENAVVLSTSDLIDLNDLMLRNVEISDDNEINLESIERKAILRALDKHRGNYTNSAEELGISRTTLYHKIKKYDL